MLFNLLFLFLSDIKLDSQYVDVNTNSNETKQFIFMNLRSRKLYQTRLIHFFIHRKLKKCLLLYAFFVVFFNNCILFYRGKREYTTQS